MNARELRARRADILETATGLVELGEVEDRDLTIDEQEQYEGLINEADSLERRAKRLEAIPAVEMIQRKAPAHLKIGRGDTEERAFCHFVRTGDDGGLRELRASNDTTMNITTDADGGYLVPTGHYNQIIARRDDASLVSKLGVRRIPGTGTSVNIPVDNEGDGEFVSTAESNAFDRDAPAIAQVTSTLVKYTKKVDLTYELLEDNDSNLMAFLSDFIGRGMAKTDNSLLLTEVAANGTSLKTFASATVIAVDELETIPFNEALGNYLDDAGSVGWVMQRAVHGEIVLLDDANTRRYWQNAVPDMRTGQPSLLGFPVFYSAASGATAASTKSVYFGNWNFVGVRYGPGLTMIRDPYTRSSYGEVVLNYHYRVDFNVLIAEAIGYGVHPSA